MFYIKGIGLGIYYRLRRMRKAFKNWRKFGVIIFGSIFLLANLAAPLHLTDEALAGSVAYLYIDPSTLSVAQGKSYQMNYRAEDQDHNQIDITPEWSVNNPVVGNITSAGLFTAGSTPGTYTNAIKLKSGVLSTYAKVVVTVADEGGDTGGNDNQPTPKVTYLYIDPSTLSINQGKNYQMKYRVEDQNHNSIAATPKWSMNNTGAGSIITSGVFTASSTPGTYNNAIKLSVGTVATYARVIVTQSTNGGDNQPSPKLTYLYIDPSTLSIDKGKTYQFKYRAEDQDHQQISANPSWSMNNSTAGNIISSGLFTAGNTPGTYNNAIKLSAGALSTYARVIILKSEEVVPPPPIQKLTYLYINPSTLSVAQGKSYQFTYRAEDQNHNQMTITPNWSMSNSAAGNITQTGLFTAKQTPGTYNNAVKLSSGVLATYARVVVYKTATVTKLEGLTIDPASVTLQNGQQKQFSSIAYDQDGKAITSGVSFKWDVTKTQAGGITQTGLFTADNHPGTYNNVIKVTATYGGVAKTAYATVTVKTTTPPVIVLTAVRLNPASARVHTGQRQQFVATAYDQYGTAYTTGPGLSFYWEVTNSLAGSINQSGLFTADYRTGNYTNLVKVTATYNGVAKSAMANAEIYEEAAASTLTSVGINPTQIALAQGSTYQFGATAYDQLGQVINSQVFWSWAIVNGGGSIDQNGHFTANYQAGIFPSTVRVTATKDGVSKSAYATVVISQIISQALLERVEITPHSVNLHINQQYDFNAQAYDANGNPVFDGVSYVWSVISGPGSIDQNGLFSANSLTGTATIQVRAIQGSRDRYALATIYVYDGNQPDGVFSSVRISPSTAYLNTGAAIDFNAQAYNANGQAVSADYSWDLMSNIGTLNQDGYFVAGSSVGSYHDVVRVRAYRDGIERIDYADVVISSTSPYPYNYGLGATLSATDENGGTTYENDIIVFTLQLTNNDSSNALTNASASFEMPKYTTFVSVTSTDGVPTISGRTVQWNVGTLYANYTKTLTIKVRVNSPAPSNTILQGKALVWTSQINSFWVYANDLWVAGTGQPDYDNGIPLTSTGSAVSWAMALFASLAATVLTKKFLLRSLI
ncbi:MAG: hypothetical protein V1807_00525 [Patescibacteria group bacterium]